MNKEVSVIISTLNEENNIEECLNCLLIQKKKPSEILVIDNGSEDKTHKIVKNLIKKYKMNGIQLKLFYYPYGNQTNTRGFGVSKAKGPIVASIDADAKADKNWVSNIEKHFQNPDVVGIGGASRYRNKGKIMNLFYSLTYYLRLIFNLYCIGGGNSAFRKSIFLSVKGYTGLDKLRKEKGILFAKDDFFLSKKLEQKGKIQFCPDVKVTLLYRIRVNKNKDYKKNVSIIDVIRRIILETIYDYKIRSYFNNNPK